MDTLKRVMHPIHKEGHVFIAIAVVITLIFSTFSPTLTWIGIIITCWVTYFFRDPNRVIPQKDGVVVSPGDGVVSKIEEASPPPELEMGDEPMTRISIFLNIFNVHVQRVPVAGKVERLYYNPGKFLNATLDKASDENERQSAWVKTADGTDIVFVQIAGLIARRIVCNLENNQEVETGERYGLIRFGSRCDVYIPKSINPLVAEGQIAVGGETILANLKGDEEAREFKSI